MRVYSRKPMSERLSKYYVNTNGCWIWTGSVNRDGYGRLRGSIDGKIDVIRAPRASWEHYKSSIPKGLMVLHTCDVPACINPDHLYLGTQKENGNDKKIRGRGRTTPQCGEKNGMYGRVGELNPMFGKKHTQEALEKMRKPKIRK